MPNLRRLPTLAANRIAIVGLVCLALVGGIAIDRLLLRPASSPEQHEEEEADASPKELSLDADRIRDAQIAVERITAGNVANHIIAQATIAPTPEGAAIIGARADGTVTKITKRLGDAVARGEVLGSIQSRDAARLAEERASAQARLLRAERDFERQKTLQTAGATSRQNYDAAESEWRIAQAEASRARSAGSASGLSSDGISLNIISPIAGRVTTAPAVLGAYVVAGTELFRVADPAKLEVQAAVPSAEAQRIAIGDQAVIDHPQGAVPAAVRAITPDINLQSRAATVVLVPRSRNQLLQPGQLVSVRIIVAHGHTDAKTLLVPSGAIQKIDGVDAVFVRTPKGFRVRQVITGTQSGTMIEVRSGLNPNDQVATTNSFLLKAELEKGSGGDDD